MAFGAAATLSTEQNRDAMTASEVQANSLPNTETKPAKLGWFHPTPGRLLVVLLAVEGVLLFSEAWFPKGWAVLISIAAVASTIVLMLLWFAAALVFRWRFQFSVRSLLLLTVAVAVSCSWLAVRMKMARKQREDSVAKAARYHVNVAFRYESHNSSRLGAWLEETLGADFFSYVDLTIPLTHGDFDPDPLTRKAQPDILLLNGSRVSDWGLQALEGMSQVRWLDLESTQVSDVGLEHLKTLTHLQYVNLQNTKVTDAGVAKLQKALPNCKIER